VVKGSLIDLSGVQRAALKQISVFQRFNAPAVWAASGMVGKRLLREQLLSQVHGVVNMAHRIRISYF